MHVVVFAVISNASDVYHVLPLDNEAAVDREDQLHQCSPWRRSCTGYADQFLERDPLPIGLTHQGRQ